MTDLPLVSLVVFTPLIGVAVILVTPRRYPGLVRWIGLLAALASFGFSLALLGYQPSGAEFQYREDLSWIPVFGMRYTVGVDGISLVLVILTTLLSAVAILYSWKPIQVRIKEYYAAMLLLIGAAVGIGGITLAWRWYVRDPGGPRRFVDWIPFGLGPGMYRASVNKYYFDDLYQLVFAQGGVWLADLLWWFDVRVIDGLVNGSGWLAQKIGGLLRRLQTGRIQNYGLGMAAGLVIVIVVFTVFGR